MADKADKIAWWIFWFILFICLMFVALIGWGFIELVTWITSK